VGQAEWPHLFGHTVVKVLVNLSVDASFAAHPPIIYLMVSSERVAQ